jgi:hypothetical protein
MPDTASLAPDKPIEITARMHRHTPSAQRIRARHRPARYMQTTLSDSMSPPGLPLSRMAQAPPVKPGHRFVDHAETFYYKVMPVFHGAHLSARKGKSRWLEKVAKLVPHF